jgi:hypothetical protein
MLRIWLKEECLWAKIIKTLNVTNNFSHTHTHLLYAYVHNIFYLEGFIFHIGLRLSD